MLVIVAAFAGFILWYNKFERNAALTTAQHKIYWQPNSSSINQNYKIYLITNEKKFQFWEYMNQGVSDMAELLGLTYKWEASETSDVDQQIEILNNAVDSGADAILISALDAEKLSEPIREAKTRGVKIIYVNTPANEEGIITLATNNYEAGKMAGKNMIEELELMGVDKGAIGIVSVNKTNPSIQLRESGFIDMLKEDGRFTLLEPVYAGTDLKLSEEEASRMIKEHQNLVGLYATNEGTNVGVGNAIKADNNRIVGVGFDRSDATMQLLYEESLKAIIAQNPYTMGYLGMAQAFASLKGFATGPSYLDTGVSVLRKR
jgi:ribose transport system substrate-binding protein